jgi:hypothetical protein
MAKETIVLSLPTLAEEEIAKISHAGKEVVEIIRIAIEVVAEGEEVTVDFIIEIMDQAEVALINQQHVPQLLLHRL